PHRKRKRNTGRLVKRYWGLGVLAAAAIGIVWLVVAGPRFPVHRLRPPGPGPLTSQSAAPVTREIESNDTAAFANLIAPGKPVEAEIARSFDDTDHFRFNTAPPPRDLFSLEIVNRSDTLAPVLRVYDGDGR